MLSLGTCSVFLGGLGWNLFRECFECWSGCDVFLSYRKLWFIMQVLVNSHGWGVCSQEDRTPVNLNSLWEI